MSRTQYFTASSLDGFIATADHSLDWLFRLGDPEESGYAEFIAGVGAIAMGSSTYEWLLRNAVGPEAPEPQPWPYQVPTWVFTTRTLPGLDGADIRFVRGDVVPVHREMLAAAGGGNIWVAGGGELVGQFHDAGLLDDLFVQIGSAILGSGKPLLPRTIQHPALRLVSAKRIGAEFVDLHYEISGSDEADSTQIRRAPTNP